jgi:hypothetical protein
MDITNTCATPLSRLLLSLAGLWRRRARGSRVDRPTGICFGPLDADDQLTLRHLVAVDSVPGPRPRREPTGDDSAEQPADPGRWPAC